MGYYVRLLCILFITGLVCVRVEADKLPPAPLVAIDSAKAAGQSYSGDIWHAADNLYRAAAPHNLVISGEGQRRSLDDGGDGPANATTISATPYFDEGTTVGKGNSLVLTSCGSAANNNASDAWYVVTFSASATVEIWTTCENTLPPGDWHDTRLAVLNSAQQVLACNDDAPGCGNPYYQSRISAFAATATTYYIVVDGYNGQSGPYQLNVTWTGGVPCNGSNQTNAELISVLPFTDTGTTLGSCNDFDIACELSGPNTAEDYWYVVGIDQNCLMDVWTTCDAAYHDSKLAILNSSLAQVACNDDAPGCATFQSNIQDVALVPGTYYILVDGWHTAAGDYEVHVDTVHQDPGPITDLLPDIIIRESDLYDHDIVTNIVPGRTHLRLSNGTPNIGPGKLYVYGVFPDNGDGTQDINQRIYRTDGSFWDREAGQFVFHSGHNHIHVADWCIYRLREYLEGGGVGAIVAEGSKTSFCILDLAVYDSNLPNHDPDGQFHSCSSTIQGLSVGWVDIYSKNLEGQNIDITGVPDGNYWLESEADPDNHMLEFDEANNVTRVPIVIGQGPAINPDSYEPNDSRTEVDGRPLGQINSPYLGPCNPITTLANLNIHLSGNEDFFRFYCPALGTANDSVFISFQHSLGDVDMRLLDQGGTEVGASNGTTNTEKISLNGRAAGWYYLRIFGYNGATNPAYSMTIDPPANGVPSVTVINPPAGNINLIHGADTYTTTWTSSDPEGNLRWVTIYVNTQPALDGNEVIIPTSLHTDASLQMAVINSAYSPAGTYWVYASITDGGTTSGDWSDGTITWGEAAPNPVDDLVLQVVGNDVLLSWTTPVGPVDAYHVYSMDTPDGVPAILDEVSTPGYTHVGAALSADLKFYLVTVHAGAH